MARELNLLINELYQYMKETLGFDKEAKIKLLPDQENAKDPLGKTGQYNPRTYQIQIFSFGRHPKDILRSTAHEIIHHYQNCNNKFDFEFKTEEGYAQKNSNLRNLEKEAYERGNIIFRDWEDNKKMKKNNSLYEHIREKNPNNLNKFYKKKNNLVFKNLKKKILNESFYNAYQEGEPTPDIDEQMTYLPPQVGSLMLQYHNGMSDPLYKVGSLAVESEPIPSDLLQEAGDIIEELQEEALSFEEEKELKAIISEIRKALQNITKDNKGRKWQ